jgi:hypothetical protein
MVLTMSNLTRFRPPAFIMEATRIIAKPIIKETTGLRSLWIFWRSESGCADDVGVADVLVIDVEDI